MDVSSFVETVKFEQSEFASYHAHRRVWQKATDWLNESGKIAAKLTEGPIDEKKYVKMCITMKRKRDR